MTDFRDCTCECHKPGKVILHDHACCDAVGIDHRMPDEGDECCPITVDDDDGDVIGQCIFRKDHEGKCGF